MQGSAALTETVDAALDCRIPLQGWCMMRLDPRINDDWTATAPVLVLDEAADTVHVV